MPNGFGLDNTRLSEISLRAYQAYESGKGIFRHKERYLPQWALPSDFEFSPQRREVRNPDVASNYLFLLASLEKRAQSRMHIRNGMRVWRNPELRWIFDSNEVVKRKTSELRLFFRKNFNYDLGIGPNYKHNMNVMLDEFGGVAKNVINNQTVEYARKRLMRFQGLGTGIANLFIVYCTDREIANVQDPEKIKVKVDIHKTRIPANTNALKPNGNGMIKRDSAVTALEDGYLRACTQHGMNGGILDSALWIVGSEICAKKDKAKCVALCPLEEMCESLVAETETRGAIIVYRDGKRVETRREIEPPHSDQISFL